MRKTYLFFVLLFLTLNVPIAHAQVDSKFHFLKKMEFPVTSFAVDNIGELYVINADNQLIKYDANGDSVGVFNQVTRYGRLSYVVAQNPWKAILFYENFSTIVLLDKYLNVVNSINLRNKNIFRVKAVTTSYDNNIWLFDEQEAKLKKIDDAGNLLFESMDFRLLFDTVPSPVKIIDRDGLIYLYDPQKGLFMFDYYGSFKTRLQFTHWQNFDVIAKTVYGFDNENIYKYSPPLPVLTTVPLPEALQHSRLIELNNHKIYFLKNRELGVYSIQ